MRAPFLLVLVALLSGCHRRGRRVDDPLPALLAAADAAWDARDGEEGLEPAEELLDQAYALAPTSPRVLWRLVRHRHAVALTEETARATVYTLAEARALGIECLDGDPAFGEARRARGWADAAGQVGEEQRPCRAWTALVWSRWVAELGADAASLDLPAAFALAEASQEDPDAELAVLGLWSRGILLGVAPDWAGGDPARAVHDLDTVIRRSPSNLVPRADLLLFGGGALQPASRDQALEELREAVPRWPEEEGAARRVATAFPG